MERIYEFLLQNTDFTLFGLILFSGLFVKKYVDVNIKTSYKILLTSVLISAVFYIASDCKTECITKYLFTYFFATSTYELLVAWVVKKFKSDTQQIGNQE